MLYLQTNPGKVFISGLTSGEVSFVQGLYNLPYATGDILYYDGTQLQRLPIGSDGQTLRVSSGIPDWNSSAGIYAYTHDQDVADSVWTVVHNLDHDAPVITVFDSDGIAIEPEIISVIDNNTIEITLGEDVAGKATVVTNGGTTPGGSGTVTSVAITVPTGLSVSGSPITTSGTFAITLASGYVIPQQSTLDAKLTNITGYLSAGSNVTVTGTGTLADPYVINASAGSGAQTLQDVLDLGNTAEDTSIILTNSAGTEVVELDSYGLNVDDGAGKKVNVDAEGIEVRQGSYANRIQSEAIGSNNYIQTLQARSGTIAHTDQLLQPGGSYEIPHTNSAGNAIIYNPGIQFTSANGLKLTRYADSQFSPVVVQYKSRGSSTTPADIQNNDIVTNYEGYARLGGAFVYVGTIRQTMVNVTTGSEEYSYLFAGLYNGAISTSQILHGKGIILNQSYTSSVKNTQLFLGNTNRTTYDSDNTSANRIITNTTSLNEVGTGASYTWYRDSWFASTTINNSAAKTYTTATTFYIQPPVAGTNTTFTNTYTIYSTGRMYSQSMFIANTPSSAGDAVRKDYVDTQVATKQNSLGFTPEDVANKATSMAGNETSNTKYPTTKLLYDRTTLLVSRTTSATSLTPDYDAAKVYEYTSLSTTTFTLNLPTNMPDGTTMVVRALVSGATTFSPDGGYQWFTTAPVTLTSGKRYEFIISKFNTGGSSEYWITHMEK